MKTTKHIVLIISVLIGLLTTACTQSDGHIGPIFGSWILDSETVDGTAVEVRDETGTFTVWRFQQCVIGVGLCNDAKYSASQSYGNFELTDCDKTLQLDFTGQDDAPAHQEGGYYWAPYWMGFPKTGKFTLTVDRLNGSKMDLTWNDPESGKVYQYHFRKTW